MLANRGVLSGEQITSITRWEQPAMEGGGQLLTARQLESLQQQAYEEAHAAGYEAGKAEAREHLARFDAIMRTLARPLDELDARVEEELVALAIAVARQLIRRELRTDPGEVVAAVREALALLPVGVREVRVHLHPEDAKIVRTLASSRNGEIPHSQRPLPPAAAAANEESPHFSADELQMWRIVEDPVLARGGCRIESESSQIDARLETRIGAVVSRLLGGARSDDARD